MASERPQRAAALKAKEGNCYTDQVGIEVAAGRGMACTTGGWPHSACRAPLPPAVDRRSSALPCSPHLQLELEDPYAVVGRPMGREEWRVTHWDGTRCAGSGVRRVFHCFILALSSRLRRFWHPAAYRCCPIPPLPPVQLPSQLGRTQAAAAAQQQQRSGAA